MDLVIAIGVIIVSAVIAGVFSSPAFMQRELPEEIKRSSLYNEYDC